MAEEQVRRASVISYPHYFIKKGYVPWSVAHEWIVLKQLWKDGYKLVVSTHDSQQDCVKELCLRRSRRIPANDTNSR